MHVRLCVSDLGPCTVFRFAIRASPPGGGSPRPVTICNYDFSPRHTFQTGPTILCENSPARYYAAIYYFLARTNHARNVVAPATKL
jgi:hypothetical protein